MALSMGTVKHKVRNKGFTKTREFKEPRKSRSLHMGRRKTKGNTMGVHLSILSILPLLTRGARVSLKVWNPMPIRSRELGSLMKKKAILK